MIEARGRIEKATSFTRFNQFKLSKEIMDYVQNSLGDPATLVRIVRRADYYNWPKFLTKPLKFPDDSYSDEVISKFNELGLLFREDRFARFFRTMFCAIKNILPSICNDDYYEQMIPLSSDEIEGLKEHLSKVLEEDEFRILRLLYGYNEHNCPLYISDFDVYLHYLNDQRFGIRPCLNHLGTDKELLKYFDRCFKYLKPG